MNTVIHLGLPRTGTKFLQYEIFPKFKHAHYSRKMYKLKDFFYRWKRIPHLVQIHTEIFSGESYSNVENYPYLDNDKHRYYWIDRIKQHKPDADIILITRNKKTHMHSMHNKMVQSKETNIRSFNKWRQQYNTNDIKEFYDYKKYIDVLSESFNTVYIDSYEHLDENADEFVQCICDFIGDKKPRYTNRKINPSVKLELIT